MQSEFMERNFCTDRPRSHIIVQCPLPPYFGEMIWFEHRRRECTVESSWSTATVAIGESRKSSATTQLLLLIQSKVLENIGKKPMKFLKQHCPNRKASIRLDGILRIDAVEDPAFQPPCGRSLDVCFSSVEDKWIFTKYRKYNILYYWQ